MGSLLYALEIPPEGGDTLFNNMYRAYEALPAATKSKIDDLKAEFLIGSARKYYTENERPPWTEAQLASVPPVEHPVVRTHPETKRKALYVNPAHTVRILGLHEAEADALLIELMEHSVEPQFVYRHKWRLHDRVLGQPMLHAYCGAAAAGQQLAYASHDRRRRHALLSFFEDS